MKLKEIQEIHKSLQKLGEERLPIGYELARNLKLCNNVIKDYEEVASSLFSQYGDKNDSGELVNYAGESGQVLLKISDPVLLEQYQKELQKLQGEEHNIKFLKIPKSKLDGRALEGNTLVPLLDVIIEE